MRRLTALMVMAVAMAATGPGRAGGGPENVMILFNADSDDASSLAAYYAEQRDIPANRLCGLQGIDPTLRSIPFSDYVTEIHDPLAQCLQNLPDRDDIDYIVIIRGLPYRVDLPGDGYKTSLSAMVQILDTTRTSDGTSLAGQPELKSGTHFQASIQNPVSIQGNLQAGDFTVQNQYSGWYESATGIVRASEQPHSFRSGDTHQSGQWDMTGNLFIVTRLDGFDFEDARALVDRSVASDGTFPTAEILCMAGSDQARGARDPECEFATRYLSAAGFNGQYLDTFDSSLSGHQVAAYLTGTANLRDAIAGNTYVPGAITGNLTSTGAAPGNFFCNSDGSVCPASESQTSIARFIRAGATGAHGAVAEPLNNVFPNAGVLLLYTFGYNLGESYFFNQRYAYWVNLYLGDPLASPYAERPVVQVSPTELPLNGSITVDATHPAGIAQTRMYLDGVLVAEGDGGHLEFLPDQPALGDTYSILAVAIANNVPQHRTGWPNEDQHPQPDIQGWTSSLITVVDAAQTDAGADDGGLDGMADDGETHGDGSASASDGGNATGGSKSGCDCRAGSSHDQAPWWPILLLGFALFLLRRRKHASRN
ncbi:MAG: TIGR03790 family protein [Deltaproteobacteria bacterium]|nr:TIGR03790 family protein [Deltaproteobacteria bacterium]